MADPPFGALYTVRELLYEKELLLSVEVSEEEEVGEGGNKGRGCRR